MVSDYCRQCMNKLYGSLDCCTSPFVNCPGFVITLSDAARIVKNTKYKTEDFLKIIFVSDEDMGGNKNNSYFSDLMFDNKFLYLYGVKKCPFRKKYGCSIYEHRPMMCRLFPFWFRQENNNFKIVLEWGTSARDENCLICKKNFKCSDMSLLLGMINETEESMLENIRQFNDEIRLHKKLKHEILNKNINQVIKENF